MRVFNTSGPNILEKHYTLPRLDWVERGKKMVYNDSDIVKFARGKKQLAQYANSLSLTSAIYLVFVESEITNPKLTEVPETIDGVLIKTHLVPYNLAKDF
jgi:hypothetical protein